MSLLSLIAALLLEQVRPLGSGVQPYRLFTRYARYLERHLNAGERRHGIIAWGLAVLLPVVAVFLAYHALYVLSPMFAWALGVGILYLFTGFRQVNQFATQIGLALKEQDLPLARQLLGQWQGRSAEDFDASTVARVTIEQTLLGAHRMLFGTFFWLVLLGPAGVVLYRIAQVLSQKWGRLDREDFGDFGNFSLQAFEAIDWVPARLTAIGFAVMGDFEDAVYCWRTQAAAWANQRAGTVLASGAGALGVRLGEPLSYAGTLEYRPELGLGDTPDPDYVPSAVGLVWRALVLWLVLMGLLTVASWVGG